MLNSKPTILLWSLILLHASPITPQDNNLSYPVKAIIYTTEGDTLPVTIENFNPFNIQNNFKTTDSAPHDKIFFSPKDLLGFTCFPDSNRTWKYVSMPNPNDLGRLFIREIYSGTFSLFKYYEIDYSSNVLTYTPSYIIWKNEWVQPAISRNFELKSLLYHFADCPELAYKIKTGTYGIADIDTIIYQYENCELTDEYEYFYE